jgi:hypothetical protein
MVQRLRPGYDKGKNGKPRGTLVTPDMGMAQVKKYDQIDPHGHLYGAIIASLRDYFKTKSAGKYPAYHLAFRAHYVADLSQPLHNIEHSPFNQRHHREIDGIVNDEVLDNLDKIKIYPISITSERDLAKEIASIANLSLALGYKLEDENRILTREEAYRQLSRSASLIKAILQFVSAGKDR